MTTRADLRDKVRAKVGDDQGGMERFPSATLNMWLAEEFDDLCGAADWPHARSYTDLDVTADTSEYSLPDDCLDVLWVSDGDGDGRLPYVTEFQFFNDEEQSDADPVYTLRGDGPLKLLLKPAPETDSTGAYRVHYTAKLQFPDTDTTDVVLPSRMESILTYRVAARCAERDRDYEQQAMFEMRADRKLQSAVTLLGDRTGEAWTIPISRAEW